MKAESTAGWRRPFVVLLGAVAVVTIAWLVVVVVWRDAPFSLTFDDAFYYFGIARNVAHGHGSTFDGIDLTNGYHPLWMLMAVPVYALGLDGTGAVRVLLVVQVLCYGGALALIAWTCARAVDGWPRLAARRAVDADRAGIWCSVVVGLALVAAAGNPFVVKIFVNGMESGVLVLLDAAVLAIVATWRGRLLTRGTGAARWATGLLLAGVVLARTDSVLLLAVMGVWALAEVISGWRRGGWRRFVLPLVQLFALPAVTLVAYLVSNQLMFGVVIQISGLTKRAPVTLERAAWFAVALLIAALIGRWGYRRSRTNRARSRFGRVGGFAASTAWFASFCVLLIAYYQVFQTQQWLWYYCPPAIYLLFLLVIGVADFAEAAVVEAPEASVARALLPVSAILLVPLVAGAVYETRQFTDPHGYSIAVADRDAGVWIDQHLAPGTVLAAWDAGALGYYANRPVINLDGVANSYAYYQANRNGTTGRFLSDRNLAGIVNLGTPVEGQDPQIVGFVQDTLGAKTAAGLRRAQVWPFTYSGTTTGAAGAASGTRQLAIFLYLLPTPPAHTP